jgi:hypothetical protein
MPVIFQALEKNFVKVPSLGKVRGNFFQSLGKRWLYISNLWKPYAPGGLAPPERKFCG